MLNYSILFKEKVDFNILPIVKPGENIVCSIKSSVSSGIFLRMIVGSTEKKIFGEIPDLLFLMGLNDELDAHLLSSDQDSYDSQYAQIMMES